MVASGAAPLISLAGRPADRIGRTFPVCRSTEQTGRMHAVAPGEVYAETRRRLIALVAPLDAAGAATVVPACPLWNVTDTVAHVVGIIDDLRSGRLDGLGSDAWTAAQVERRRGMSLVDCCAEWEALAPTVDALAAQDPWMVTRLVADLVTHEHDIRGALQQPGARDSAAIGLGLVRYAPFFLERVGDAGLAPVAVEAGERRWGPAPGEAAITVTGSPFEVLRALTGRRSRAQVARLRWDGADPSPYLPLISPYGQPLEDLVE